MKRTVIFPLCVLAVCLLATQAWSQAHYYMTLDMGNSKEFDVIEGDGTHMDLWPLLELEGWTYMRYRITGGLFHQWTIRTSLDDEGNVWHLGTVEIPAQPAEPILWLDAPLYAGKAWEQTVNFPGYGDYQFSHVCEAAEEVTVPFGTFWCFRVRHIQDTYPLGITREDVFWYCDGIGIVKVLFDNMALAVLANGIIPVKNATWGAVKNLYR